MPVSLSHEGIVRLFENRPDLAPELLRDVLHQVLPAYQEARISSESINVLPAVLERRADLVVLLFDNKPVLAIIVEVQLAIDKDKLDVWPAFVTISRTKFGCEACVLVVTPAESVAVWARQGVRLGPANHFSPLVIGPNAVPVVDDPARATQDPELAVLSVMAHGKDPVRGARVALAAFQATRGLDEERILLYSDLIESAISDAARATLQELLMSSGNYEFQSEFAKTHQAKGKAEGEAKSILRFLRARKLTVSAEHEARILATTDLDRLDIWLDRAATCTSTDDLFKD